MVAERAEPPERVEEVALDSLRRDPTCRRHLQRWTVREVLLGSAARAGGVLEVRRAQDGMWLGVFRRRHLEGVNKIVEIDTYRPRRPADASGEGTARILFLCVSEDAVEFTAEGALEGLSARDEVVRLIGER